MPSVCPSYAKTGYCQLGSKCKYEHAKKEREKEDPKSKVMKKDVEKMTSRPKEPEAKLRSTVISKSLEDSDKRIKKVAETSSKSSKLSDRSPSPTMRKRKEEDVDEIRQKEKKSISETSKEEHKNDQKHKIEGKTEKSSSKIRKNDQLLTARNSSSSSKKTTEGALTPPSSKDGRSSEIERHQNRDAPSKSHSKKNMEPAKAISKLKSDPSRRDVAVKREVHAKKGGEAKEKKEDGDDASSVTRIISLKPDQKDLKTSGKTKETSRTKTEAKMSRRQRSASESTSSSSSSGSSSSSSGSSSGSSSSFSSRERSPAGKKKIKGNAKKSRLPEKMNSDCSDKTAIKKPEEAAKEMTNTKHTTRGEYRSCERLDKKARKLKCPADASRDNKKDFSDSGSPRYASPPPPVRGREELYYSSRNKTEEDKYARTKMAEPDYEQDRSHESRRVKADRYLDKVSPIIRRKESDYYRGEDYRYRRGDDEDYGSMERRRSRERSMYDLPDKEPMYSDEPMRRERISRRGQWEQIEADDLARCKHKRHLSEESFSPPRKKKRSSPHDDFRGDKIYEPEGRKREFERDDESLMGDLGYKPKHRRRSSHESWHHHSKERRSRRDKSDQDRSRERVREGYYARSPLGSGDYSPRHRPEHNKRSGDYGGYDYDVDRGRRSLSRSSIGSKAPGRSRYYDGKRSLAGSVVPPHYPSSSYEYRDPFRATPETDVMEGGRVFPGKPFWDDYKRIEGPSSGQSYRGAHTHSRASHAQSSSSGPPVEWDSGRVSSKQQSHDFDNRYERSSEEFINRRDVLLPPPPRPRLENSEVTSPAPTSSSNQNNSEAASVEVLKAMKFEIEGYEEITEEDLDECIAEEDADEAGDKDEVQSTCEDDAETLPKKIPLVDMSDIEWETLVKSDVLGSNGAGHLIEQKFSDIIREIGVSRQFAGDELFEKINNLLAESDDDLDEDDDGDIRDGHKEEVNKASIGTSDGNKLGDVSTNGLTVEVKIEPKENGEGSTSKDQLSVVTAQNCFEEKEVSEGQQPVGGSPEEKENLVVKTKTYDARFIASNNYLPALKVKKKKGPLLHDVANFHVTAFLKMKRQSSAMRDIGPYRRALCARRDLSIRRTLCKIEKEEIVMFPAQLADQELYKLSLQLFHQTSKALQDNLPAQHTLA